MNFKSLQYISIIEVWYWFLRPKAWLSLRSNYSNEGHLSVYASFFFTFATFISCDKENPNLWQSKRSMIGHPSLCLPLSGMDCVGACREELLWAYVFPCAWQRTRSISPKQQRAHTLPSAVALTNLDPNLSQLGPLLSHRSLLKSKAIRRNSMCNTKDPMKSTWVGRRDSLVCCAHTYVCMYRT